MTIVADTGPLLSFARAQRLDLLRDVVGSVVIPEAVYNEIVVRGAGKIGAHHVELAPWITCQHIQDRSFLERLPVKLHIGEREALALARELNGVLLVDELEVRREARHIGIAYMGSLRVLTEAKERGLIPSIKPILDELIATGTYLSDTLYQKFLSDASEG